MTIANIQPTNIEQPLGGKRIKNSKNKNIKSPSNCRDGDANPSYHPWEKESLDNFKTGGKIQCGRASTYHCNLSTVKWITGYRNTCPIAGCCGTFNRPAPLELNKFNFKNKKITKKIKIKKITLEYQHMVKGVDVGVGKGSIKENWAGVFPKVTISLYHNSNFIQSKTHKTRVPLAKYGTVSVTFDKIISNFNPTADDLTIKIDYDGNGDGNYKTEATNPSIIYAKGLNISMDYNYLEEPKILGTISSDTTTQTIITDPRNPNNDVGNNNCRTYFTHQINFKNTTASDIIVTVPSGVTYTRDTSNSGYVIYKYQDTSGIEGEKQIQYFLKSNSGQKITKTYIAKLYAKPKITIYTKYIKNQQFQDNDTFVKIEGACWNDIKIYLDGNKKELIHWTKNNNTNNVSQEDFLDAINQLTCGWHELHVYIDDTFYNKINIQIIAPDIMFSSTLGGEYNQNKYHNEQIIITRTDSNDLNQPVTVTITDTASKTASNIVQLYPQESFVQDINLHYPGTFELKYSYDNGCQTISKSFGTYKVNPTHKQSYDYLLLDEWGPASEMEYVSLVIRQGDNQREPVTYTNATLMNSMDDFVLFGGDGICNVGELGHGILAIKNPNEFSINNLCIELNPLFKSEEEYDEFDSLIMEWTTGMLQNFEDNFYILNPDLKNVIKIYNTQNQDLINEGTENVILQIIEIQPNQTLALKIPYTASYEKEIYMNFMLLGEPTDFIDIDEFNSEEEAYFQYEQYADYNNPSNKYASNTSKMLNRGCMCISLKTRDLKPTELFIEGDDLDRNDLSNPNDLDITYRVKIPESECDDTTTESIPINTKIINDARLIPTAYKIGDTITPITTTEDANKIEYQDSIVNIFRGIKTVSKNMVGADIFLRYLDENNQNKYIRAQTDKDGIAHLKYTIPDYQDISSNIADKPKTQYRLEEILNTVDIFYMGDDIYQSATLSNTIHNPITPTAINFLGFIYYTDIPLEDNESTGPFFISANDIRNTVSNSHIASVYAVGELINVSNNKGLNGEIINLEGIYTDSDEKYKFSQKGISGRTINIEGLNNKKGLFQIKISLPSQYLSNLNKLQNSIYMSYQGDFQYDKAYAPERSEGNQIQTKIYNTELTYKHDYNIYRRGETIDIAIRLSITNAETFSNTIEINFPQDTHNCYKNIHIYYKACSSKNTEGFKTIYKTNNDKLLANQTEAYIYCNVDTDLRILARLEKKLVENHNVNVLTINAINGYKPNKNVIVKALIGPDATKERLGDYLALTAVDIDKEKYSYDQSSDIVYWKIGSMNSYETQKCNILLEAEEIGHNTIYVCGFDYLNPDETKTIHPTLTLEGDTEKHYYIDDMVSLKAVLQDSETNHDIYGQVRFVKQLYDETTDEYLEEIVESASNVATYNGEHYAQGYIRLKDLNKTKIFAKYKGAKILTITYEDAESEPPLIFENISKYDTIVQLSSEQESFKTNENITIDASVLYKNGSELYPYKDLNIKMFIENQELTNILYYDKKYHINFLITQPGTYVVKAFVPETRKTEECYEEITIDVIDGENNE